MRPERTFCVGSHPCQGYRRTSCNGWDWVLLSTGSLKFRQWEPDGANGELRGGTCHRSAKAPGGEDLQVEEPVSCWDCASFHFHATVAGMLGPTLIRDEVV